jgi:uncharacterized protein (TIGR02246 family)
MTRGTCALLALAASSVFVTRVYATDVNAVAERISKDFEKACAAGNIPAVMALYADDATVIWPLAGATAVGKAGIQKLATGLCSSPNKPSLTLKSAKARALDKNYIVDVGSWEQTVTQPDGAKAVQEVRTTEVLIHTKGGWRYLVDHASIGVPVPQTGNK